jgi:hypothetical protein
MSQLPGKLRQLPLARLRDRLRLSPQDAPLLQEANTPAELLALLQERALLLPAITLLSYALPEREAVWWASMCVRHMADAASPPEQRRALDAAEAWVWHPGVNTSRDCAAAAKEAGYVSAAAFVARAAFAARLSDQRSLRAGRRVETAVQRAATWDGTEHVRERLRRFIASARDINAGGAGRIPAEPAAAVAPAAQVR